MSDKQFIQQYINVEIQNVIPQNNVKEVNTVWLISADVSLNDISDKAYKSITAVAEDFATTTNTYKMANKLFTNGGVSLRQSNGVLFISKISNATGATRAYTESATIDATKITAFNLLSNGEFQVELIDGDGDVVEVLDTLEGLDFTIKPLTIERITSIINRQLTKTAAVVSSGKIKFVSTDYNSDAKLKISPLTGGSGTDLTGSTYLNPSNGSAVAGTDGTVDMTELLTKLEDMQFAQFSCALTTSFMPTEAQAIQIAQKVKTLSNKVQYIYSTDLRNPQMATLQTEVDANKQFWVAGGFFKTTDDTGLDMLYLSNSIVATQLSQNPFDREAQQQLVQLSGKKVDQTNTANLMSYLDYNTQQKRELVDSLVADGILCYILTNDDLTYTLKANPKTVSSVLFEITNSIFVSMLQNSIYKEYTSYLQKNNLLNNLSNISTLSQYLSAEVFAPVAGQASSPIQPFTGNFADITLDTPSMTPKQQELMQNDLKQYGYFLFPYKVGTQANIYFVINTNLGLTFINIFGNNITS